MKKSNLFLSAVIFTIIFLSVVQVVISNRLSTSGIELSKLNEQIKSYKKENYILSEKLLIATSLTKIASNASRIGFVDKSEHVYLNTSLPLAVKR